MEICQNLADLVKLLNQEKAQASAQGYSTVTLTHEEVAKIAQAMNAASQSISQTAVYN